MSLSTRGSASSVGGVIGISDQPAGAVAAVGEQPQQAQGDLPVASRDGYVHAGMPIKFATATGSAAQLLLALGGLFVVEAGRAALAGGTSLQLLGALIALLGLGPMALRLASVLLGKSVVSRRVA